MSTGLYSQHLDRPHVAKIRNILIAVLLIFFGIVVLFPLVYMAAWSFGPAVEVSSNAYNIIPSSWSLDSYRSFFSFSPYSWRWILNSFIVAVCTVVLLSLIHI